MQQELILVTNRRSSVRLTAFGGGIIGAALGIAVTYLLSLAMIERANTHSQIELASMKASFETRIKGLEEENRKIAPVLSGAPMTMVADVVNANARQVSYLVDRLPVPARRSSEFDAALAALSLEAARQANEAQAFLQAMADTRVAPAAVRCLAADKPASTTPLLSLGKASLYVDGWRMGTR